MKEFTERMKWEPVCPPVEMKQGYSTANGEPCRQLAEAVAAMNGNV